MGIDLEKKRRGRRKITHRRKPKSCNIYLNLLHQLYSYLERRTSSRFNRAVCKRLVMSRNHRPPVSIQMLRILWEKRQEKAPNPNTVLVVVGDVTDDARILTLPKGMKVACLRIAEPARARIVNAGNLQSEYPSNLLSKSPSDFTGIYTLFLFPIVFSILFPSKSMIECKDQMSFLFVYFSVFCQAVRF